MKTILIILAAAFGACMLGCKKLVDVNSPVTMFDAKKIYNKEENAISVLTALYQEMSLEGWAQGANSISMYTGLSGDELIDYPGFSIERTATYKNKLTADITPPSWSQLYQSVYITNTAIQGIEASESINADIKAKLLGEAKFLRAFFFFHLVNLWGSIPLPLSNDYASNRMLSRSKPDAVYQQIISDLRDAQELLKNEYTLSDLKTVTNERIRPNKWVAKAFLSRVYLYHADYQMAEETASEVIAQESLFSLSKTTETFLSTSKETIWNIQSIDPFWNTSIAKTFVLNNIPNFDHPVSLSEDLVRSFEPGDKRRADWIGCFFGDKTYYFANKYKVIIPNAPKTEALNVFRLAELYLIRAEAKNELGKTIEAISDINKIRTRARAEITAGVPNPLPNLSATLGKEAVKSAILHERQVEFFTEWGHRWFDLKRTGKIDEVMQSIAPSKETTWNSNQALYPIPQIEITRNPNMTQNTGY